MKIAVFDDDEQQRSEWCEHLNALPLQQIHATAWRSDEFKKEIQRLEERRRKARSRPGVNVALLSDLGIESKFDELDLLVVDYDLLQATDLTGEEVACLVRCFSKCNLVLALNQFGKRRFDLSLQGHLDSYADVNIGDPFLADPGLWIDSGWNPFRPWHWPLLPDLLACYEKRLQDARDWLNQPILSCLELTESRAGILPRKTLEMIQVPGKDPEAVTFEDFVLRSGRGIKEKDSPSAIEEMKPRIAAARVHQWLEALVLAGQEVLVDAPHLVSRFPSLLDGAIEDVGSWNQTARILQTGGLAEHVIAVFRYPHQHWLSRPAWYWHEVRAHKDVREVRDPWSVEAHDWVFCEDTSGFAHRSDSKSFIADLPSAFTRRYVRGTDSIEYHPGVRFSL